MLECPDGIGSSVVRELEETVVAEFVSISFAG